MINDVFHLLPGVCCIYPDRNTAGALDTHIDQHPFRAVVSNNRNTVPFLKPHGNQGRSDLFRQFEIFVPGNIVPQPVVLVPHGHTVTIFTNSILEYLRRSIICVFWHSNIFFC